MPLVHIGLSTRNLVSFVAAKVVPVGADGKFTVTFTIDDISSRYFLTESQKAADGSTLTDSAPREGHLLIPPFAHKS